MNCMDGKVLVSINFLIGFIMHLLCHETCLSSFLRDALVIYRFIFLLGLALHLSLGLFFLLFPFFLLLGLAGLKCWIFLWWGSAGMRPVHLSIVGNPCNYLVLWLIVPVLLGFSEAGMRLSDFVLTSFLISTPLHPCCAFGFAYPHLFSVFCFWIFGVTVTRRGGGHGSRYPYTRRNLCKLLG